MLIHRPSLKDKLAQTRLPLKDQSIRPIRDQNRLGLTDRPGAQHFKQVLLKCGWGSIIVAV
jgi:hypothetical protein